MVRQVIAIDESLCDGCNDCVVACPQIALHLVFDKARIIRDALCAGQGDCIATCRQAALRIVERVAEPFAPKD